MKHFALAALVLSALALSATARADDHVIVTTVSHYTSVYHYTVNTPSTSTTTGQANATCSGTDTVNCSGSYSGQTTTYAGQTMEKAIYTFTELVNVNGQTYTLQRTARWMWSNTDEIPDGQQFDAIIKKHDMIIVGQHGGNQGKEEKLKFKILNIAAYGLAQPVTNTTTQTDTHFVGQLTSMTDLAGTLPGVRCTYTFTGYHNTTATFTRDIASRPCPDTLMAPSHGGAQ